MNVHRDLNASIKSALTAGNRTIVEETLPKAQRTRGLSSYLKFTVYSSQFTNLDQIIIPESQLIINLKSQPNISISTKFKIKILTKIQLRNHSQTLAVKY